VQRTLETFEAGLAALTEQPLLERGKNAPSDLLRFVAADAPGEFGAVLVRDRSAIEGRGREIVRDPYGLERFTARNALILGGARHLASCCPAFIGANRDDDPDAVLQHHVGKALAAQKTILEPPHIRARGVERKIQDEGGFRFARHLIRIGCC